MPLTSHAQNLAKNWYFGVNAGISFIDGYPTVLTDGQINTSEGSASISRASNGELLFYTDGVTVWNRLHNPMPNGKELHGDESTSQSALIIPWPGNTYTYIIFTPAPITSNNLNGRCFCLKYSIVDMRREDGYGDVVVKNKLLTDEITEHLTATPDCEGGGWWVIVRKRNYSAFVSFHITSEGISTVPVESIVNNSYEIRDAGQMHTSPSGSKLVITAAAGLSLLFDIDRSTGAVYNSLDLFNGIRTGTHYGATFSADSRYVFTAVTTEPPTQGTTIYRWFIDTEDKQDILASKQGVAWFGESEGWMPLQLGPDSSVYIGRPGTNILSRFKTPSMPDPGLQDTAVVLIGENRSGLPNFPGAMLLPYRPGDSICRTPVARFKDTVTCIGECIRLVDDSKGIITSWYWETPGGIPSSSRDRSPKICYNSAGSFPVTLIVGNIYGYDTVRAIVKVLFPPTVTISGNARICKGGSIKLTASGASSYVWSPSTGLSNAMSASPIASPLATTKYRVIGKSAEGCVDTAFVIVNVVNPTAGPDVTICYGDSAVLSATGAATYEWFPAAGLSDPTSPRPIAKPTQTTTYFVTMSVDSCVVTDTVIATVVASVQTSITAPSVVCAGERFVVRASGNTSEFEWIGNGIVFTNADSAVVELYSETTISVIGSAGTCSDTSTARIAVKPAPIVELKTANTKLCNGMSTEIQVVSDASTIRWTPSIGLSSDTAHTVTASPAYTTTYIVEAQNLAGCSVFDTITIEVTDYPPVDAGIDKQICKGAFTRISATGLAEQYQWEPAVGLSDPFELSPVASPSVTTTYRLTARNGSCVTVDSMTVIVSDLDLTLSGDTSICFGSSIELLATGAATYRWNPSDGLSDPTIPNPIASPTVTTIYEVVGTDRLGCSDVKYLTVSVIDTASVRIVTGMVTAQVGQDNVGIPIFVDVEQRLLPLRISKLQATLVTQADIFVPQTTDRGTLVPSRLNDERRAYLTFNDLLIVTTHQKITEVRGIALLGKKTVGTLEWDDVEWTDVICPTPLTTSGLLYLTGCGIQQRALRLFGQTQILVVPKPAVDAIDVTISGGEPGTFYVRIMTTDGRTVSQQSIDRQLDEESDILLNIDMSGFADGLYHVIIDSPLQRYAYPIVWIP